MAIRYADWANGQDFSIERNRTTAIAAWSAATTYALDKFAHDNVAYPNRKCYKSLQAGNLNHALTDAAWWVLVADGSAALPFQSSTDASQGLTGGDEVRFAESPADTALSGTLTFTENSTTLTGSGTAFTTELVIGDFVYGGDGVEYEIITISSDTAAVLYKKYPESTQAGIACVKVGITETGAAASSSTQVQKIMSGGSLTTGYLIVSGGWDLATETQAGTTKFKQRHGTFATRNGYGLFASVNGFINISKCNCYRYNIGMLFSSLNNNIINSPICNSNITGLQIGSSSNNIIISPICNSNTTGLFMDTCRNNIISSPICNSNTTAMYLGGVNTIVINDAVLKNNATAIFDINSNFNCYVNNFIGQGNYTITKSNSIVYADSPMLSFQKYNNTKGDNRNYFYGGITKSNTANARSGKCLEYNPTSATVYMSHSFFFKAVDATACALSAYVQKTAAFDGDVQGAVYFLGLPVIDWTDITPTTNDTYEQKSFSVTSGMVTDDSVLELRIKVRGTAGAVYVDDLGSV